MLIMMMPTTENKHDCMRIFYDSRQMSPKMLSSHIVAARLYALTKLKVFQECVLHKCDWLRNRCILTKILTIILIFVDF